MHLNILFFTKDLMHNILSLHVFLLIVYKIVSTIKLNANLYFNQRLRCVKKTFENLLNQVFV